ncbi:hypothetical protein DFH06DRAFT_1314768 [Mycena polygramma]|nr:hypothetical protein DFH06DRAFT_1314768 [Mycena polygramma]
MDVDSSSNSSSSQPTSPSSESRTTRSSATLSRLPAHDPEQIASLAQKLYEALKGFKSSKNKTNVSIPISEFENILSRSQQVALLTSVSSRRPGDDALLLQIAEMSDRLSDQLTSLESKLGNPPHTAVDEQPIPIQRPLLAAAPVLEGTRHSSLYLPDGNLVMAAPISDGAGGTMLFRVHQSMLALQSPVFASMLSLPHPDATRDAYDGAPFVRMPDDCKDIESMLKVLYNPSELPYKRLDPLTPINVRRTLAMATKYEMEALRDRIVAQLQADWPNTLTEWDRLETEVESLLDEHESKDDETVDGLYLDERLPEPAAAIRLAMDCNVPRILPAALYHLSRLKTDDDWLEYRKDRTTLLQTSRTARWDLLEAADYKLLLKIREMLTDHYYASLYSSSNNCLSSPACRDSWGKTYLQWQRANDPLGLMKSFAETRPSHLICKNCWNVTKPNVLQCRSSLWDKISAIAVGNDT